MYAQKVNVVTGKQEWAVQGDDYEYSLDILRSQYSDMVRDLERVCRR